MSNSNKSLSRLSQNALLGLLLMIVGIVFCIHQSGILDTLFTIVGAILIVLGMFELFNKNWIIGAIELAAGIVIIVFAWVGNLKEIALLMLGIALSAYAIYLLVMAIINFKNAGAARIFVALVAPLLMLTIGILLIVAYCVSVDNLFIAVGAIAIAVGVFIIVFELIKDLKRNTASSSSSSKSTTTKKTTTKSKKSSK